MQRGDKIALGTAIPLIVIVIVLSFLLILYVKPCAGDKTWDSDVKACRTKCPGEGKPGGQKFDKTTRRCVCPDVDAPVLDSSLLRCVGVCDAGTTWNPQTRSCEGTPQKCYPLPSVNTTTGAIVNAANFDDGKGGCNAGSSTQLDHLCTSAECSSPQYCRPGDRWDGVSTDGLNCYKLEVCGLLPCDAAYCTSDTVHANVGPIMKVADSNGYCINPSEAAVGTMCTASAPTNVWHAPNCYNSMPLNTLQLSVTSASNELGKGIVGTVQHELLNGQVDLNADGTLFYSYILSAPTAFTVNNKLMRVATGDNDVATGFVTITGVCTASDATSVCYTFQIDSADLQNLPLATYVLRLTGYPSWDVSLPLYTTGQPQGFTLSGSSVMPDALTKLDVKFSKDDAKKVAANTVVIKSNLLKLQSDLLVPDLTMLPLAYTESNDALVASCQSGVCKTNETITRKFVILAWASLRLDKYALAGICPGSDSVIKYYLARLHTETRNGQTVVINETLIGPTTAQGQPTKNEVELADGIVSFVDVVDVNRTYTYSLGAYLADGVESTLEYRNAKCFGTLRQMLVSIDRYTAAACHDIKYGVADALPPNMTVTSAGTCEYNDSQPAQDFYCLYEFGSKGFDPANVALSSNKSCYPVLQMYPAPTPTNTWNSPFATTPSFDACIAGESQDLTVVCPDKVELDKVGETFDKSAFQSRLKNVYENFDTFNYTKSWNKDVLLNDIFDKYAKCPPLSDPKYGNAPDYANCKGDDPLCTALIIKRYCADGDELCKNLVKNANCGYNECGTWEPVKGTDQEYKINRSLFVDALQGDASSKCCSGKGTYSKGKCTCESDKIFGLQCETDPCEKQFRDHRAKRGFDCTPLGSPSPTGTCIPEASGAVSCACNANYFNVAQPPALDSVKDCKWYKKEYINNPDSPSGSQQFNPFHDNPKKMACEAAQRLDPNTSLCDGIQCNPFKTVVYPNLGPVQQRDDACIVDPYSCTCPEVLPDPYMCRQLQLPDNQKGGNVFPDPMNPKEAFAATACNVKCSGHKPTPAEPYKFADPENNNFACTTCHVAGSCEEVQDSYNKVDASKRVYCYDNAQKHMSDPVQYALDPECANVNELQNSKLLFPNKYCTDCCFYYCKKNSHDHHWCDNGKWPSS